MLVPISRTIFRLQGWRFRGEHLADHPRCVVIGAPHTSNWDMVYTLAAFDLLDLPLRFTIKRQWMQFPFDRLIEPAGGLEIDRRPREETGERPSMVEAMVELFDRHPDELALVITPEATRSRNERWKSGFYYVAQGADVPILVGYCDYAKREAGIAKVLSPHDPFEDVMGEMMDFYRGVTPRHPERFSLDSRFA